MSETKSIRPIDEIRQSLERMESQFKAALPSHVTPEKFIRVVMTAIQSNSRLLEGDRTSLFASCVKCAADGLLPDGRDAALVPFGNKIQYMPMVSGILKKVRNSGELSSLAANMIHENDKFEYWVNAEGEHLKHEPQLFSDRGKVIGVYSLAKVKSGGVYVEVLNIAEIEKVRNISRTKDSGPWKEWFDEMAKKTAIRRLAKRLPMSSDLEGTIHADDEIYELKKEEIIETTTVPQNLSKIIEEEQSVHT